MSVATVRRLPALRARSRGFTLIEVLVAVLVLALGLLGFAMLQTTGLKYSQSANYRTQATNLASDLLDQMRANRLAAAQYGSASFTAGSVSGTACTRTLNTVAIADSISRWQCQVVAALGDQASAQVTYNAGTATILLRWGERFAPAVDSVASTQSETSFNVVTRL